MLTRPAAADANMCCDHRELFHNGTETYLDAKKGYTTLCSEALKSKRVCILRHYQIEELFHCMHPSHCEFDLAAAQNTLREATENVRSTQEKPTEFMQLWRPRRSSSIKRPQSERAVPKERAATGARSRAVERLRICQRLHQDCKEKITHLAHLHNVLEADEATKGLDAGVIRTINIGR